MAGVTPKSVSLPDRSKDNSEISMAPTTAPEAVSTGPADGAALIAPKSKKEKKDKGPRPPRPEGVPPKKVPARAPPKKEAKEATPAVVLDPQAMFKEGFLRNVYNERPEKKIFTRFPPEPNGYLHIGHSKAIAINFGFAKHYGGECYLRFDDTNPEAEEEKYFVAIQEMIQWLGFKPYRITYSSDNFERLYQLAEDLIMADGAYVCHCTDEEVKKQRGEGKGLPRYACSHRTRPVEESLKEFRAMKDGKYKPKEATLRMKQDLEDGNPQMWDLMAYRVLDAEHHRTGAEWKIYPTYDFTHCLCDSFEQITHSLCTTEFQQARTSYEWLCDAVNVYKPMQREYGRLNVTGTVLSKRKIAKLVKEGIVRGWDDPRLYTLVALRRRGIPPGAILSFINELGVSTARTNIQLARFENSVRKYLEQTAPRLMLVLDPIPVIIDDVPDDFQDEFDMPFNPKDASFGSHKLPFTKTVYIDRSDFREVDDPDYFRLAPGKVVGLLKVPYPIKATTFTKDQATGLVTEVRAVYAKAAEGEKPIKPKTYIQWVGASPKHNSPIKAEIRVFGSLFRSEDPDLHPDGFMADLNPKSEEIYPNALIEVGLKEIRDRAPWPEEAGEGGVSMKENDDNATAAEKKAATAKVAIGPETVRFQGLRVGYFALDKETDWDAGKVVLNRIVSLKEDTGKS